MVELRGRLHSHWRSITDQKLRLELLLTEARKRLPAPFDATQTETIANEASHLLDAFYVSFEDRYRGTRDDIKNRQKIYVPYARKAAEATGGELIDIGCGRGEWLELLGENGLAASGIDLNRVMVEECHARGLKATLGDALEVLRSLPERSLGAVTGFHIIEHLPFDVLVTLFDEVLRVLKPGGMVIFETPNPANLQVAAERFYMDPTHLNPLPSDLISFIATARGSAGSRCWTCTRWTGRTATMTIRCSPCCSTSCSVRRTTASSGGRHRDRVAADPPVARDLPDRLPL